ncbi:MULTISPECIES: hypothetical protein [unclassified Sinorhizobium]
MTPPRGDVRGQSGVAEAVPEEAVAGRSGDRNWWIWSKQRRHA